MPALRDDPEFIRLIQETEQNLKDAEELIHALRSAGMDVKEYEKQIRENKVKLEALKRALGIK